MANSLQVCMALLFGLLSTGVAAATPSSWALWTATITVSENVSINITRKGGDPGYGVDLDINSSEVHANVWDDDGDAYFIVQRQDVFCKVSVGSNGLGPGLVVDIFQQRGLACELHNETNNQKNFSLVLTVSVTQDDTINCDSSNCPGGFCPEDVKRPCNHSWRAPRLLSPRTTVPPSWILYAATLTLPANTNIRKIRRGNDEGYGVDLQVLGNQVDAGIWDDDGDAFFMVSRANVFCKISVGSNGLGPGLMVEIFEQRGLVCTVASSTGGPKRYALSLAVDSVSDEAPNCNSTLCPDGACPANTTGLCNKVWRPNHHIIV